MKMFNFKRNLSIRDSPEKSISDSPVKRIRASTPVKCVDLATSFATPSPPPTPAPLKAGGSLIDSSIKRKQELEVGLKSLDEQLDDQYNLVKSMREKINSVDPKRFIVEDYLAMASKGQYEVRNLLNEMYNPGNEVASKATVVITETKRNHTSIYNKMAFDMNRLMETAEIEIEKKMKCLNHELELQQRTMSTLEIEKKIPASPDVNANLETETPKEANKKEDDDDCIIIEENQDRSLDIVNEVELPNQVQKEENQDIDASCNNETNPSEGTGTYEEDEQTDIDEPKDEEERSFTPCQAQRPN